MKKIPAPIIAAIAFVLFGSTALIVRPSILSALDLVFWRMVVCFLLTFLFMGVNFKLLIKNVKIIRTRSLLSILATSCAIFLNMVFLFQAFKLAPITLCVALFYIGPIFSLVLRKKLKKQKLLKVDIVAALIAGVGVVILIVPELSHFVPDQIQGMGFALLGGLLFGLIPIVEEGSSKISPMLALCIQSGFAALCLYPFIIFDLSIMDQQIISQLLVLGGLFTFIPFLMWWYALRKTKNLSPFVAYMDPFTAILIGLFILDDDLTASQIVGCITLGLAAIYHTWRSRRRALKVAIDSNPL